MTNPTDPRINAAARALYEGMFSALWQDETSEQTKSDFREDARLALKAADAAAWRPISEAPKDRTLVLAKIHDDLFPRIRPERKDLKLWNGRWVVVSHAGILESGFDLGWTVAAPVGWGGMVDDWFVGWQPLPAAPVMGGSDE
ncbi:hypothetical protein HKD27_06000 [Gluconobacter sp. R75690]|uniref:hypothetical protein n=1 Tax=unclassified Gluconobacter TaxID=2644261 RepID=UPI00188A9053|nr:MULTISPECIES: hypothetical protein [unclassified Gluconobacter]MBF0850477.1 hypothetical protein [Gluconobacter sp. R75690]MBF0879169.1 hypothetical protein [Gluconobacter sp. R75828]